MLKVTNLRCERDQRLLFDGLAFTAQPGDIIQVVGPNGAGKSTLLKILCGVYDEFEGDVEWDLKDHPLYLGHRPGVNDYLTVAENLVWLAQLHEQTLTQTEIDRILTEVGLRGYADVPCSNLSEGQRKRVSLARFYVFTNRVWILDEPFSAIDTAGITSLETLIQGHADSGGLVLLTSHQPLRLSNVRQLLLDPQSFEEER
jgi:heme exporter protein A